jgi:hypothetical protein
MKRVLIASSASVVALLLTAPEAPAASQLRHLQGDLQPVGAPQKPGGQIGFDVIFKNKRGAKKKFTPRQLVVIDIERMPLTCVNSPGQAGTEAILTTTIQTRVKVRKAPPPGPGKPKANRYSFKFATGFTGFTGAFSGKIFKRQGRGEVIANGRLTVDHLDFSGGPTNCSSTGPRGWSAFTKTTPAPA